MNSIEYILSLIFFIACIIAFECRKKKRIRLESDPILNEIANWHRSFCAGYKLHASFQCIEEIEAGHDEDFNKHARWENACNLAYPKKDLLECSNFHKSEERRIRQQRDFGNPSPSSIEWSNNHAERHRRWACHLNLKASQIK